MGIQASWIWMGLAAIFIIGEIFTAGFFLLWFGIGAAAAGVLALLGVDVIWQLVAFVVVSLALYLASRRFADRVTRQQPPGVGADRYLQQQGIVLDEVNRVKHTGRVRLGGDEWRAESAGDEVIPAGATVTVVKVDGTFLVVRRNKEV